MDLFDDADSDQVAVNVAAAQLSDAPLAARMRPVALDEIVGQSHLLGPGRPLRLAIERDQLRSAIFYGPPGCGKSTLASVIARTTSAAFANFSAVTGGVADVRKLIDAAKELTSVLPDIQSQDIIKKPVDRENFVKTVKIALGV